jgi:hypothetical protein
MLYRFFEVYAGIAIVLTVAGCGQTTPPLSHVMNNFPVSDYIPVSEVVDRVKCDMARAFDSRIKGEGANDALVAQYQWLQNWTAAVNLTLQVNETGSITPTAAYVLPLKNAYNFGTGPSTNTGTAISATSRNFTFGFGGTYSGEAVRTELLSFALSLKELKYWYHHGGSANCDLPDGLDLEGRIDLTTWVEEALKPVDADDLQSGNHVAPTTQKAASTPPSKTEATLSEIAKVSGPKPPPEVYQVNMQILRAACVSAAGNDADQQKLCADKVDKDALYQQCVANAGKTETAKTACDVAKDVFPKSDPKDDPTYFAPGGNEAANQAVVSAKQADDSKTQAQASEAKAEQSYNSAKNFAAKLEKVKDSVDPGFLSKVNQNVKTAEVAAGNAATWRVSAEEMANCAETSSVAAKADASNDKAADAIAEGYYAFSCAKLAAIVAKNAATQASKATSSATAAKSTPNPPIESISQSLQFLLTLGLTASPSWTLLYWKAPSMSGNLLNLNGIRTHTLDIALGPPGPGGAKTGPAQQAAIANLGLIKVQNAINAITPPQ